MKNLTIFLLSLSFLPIIFSCESGQIECQRASSNVISETRDLRDFRGVVFNNVGDLLVTQGPDYKFEIRGPENVVEFTSARIEDELLIIGTDVCFNGEYDLVMEISAPNYELLSLAGIGRIESQGQIAEDILRLELIGIGEVEADFDADTLYTTIAGTGEITLGGQVSKHQITSSGQFTFNGFSLDTEHTFINITGIGDSYVTANETLTVIIDGTGNVYYQGNPDIQSEITGSGDIINSN